MKLRSVCAAMVAALAILSSAQAHAGQVVASGRILGGCTNICGGIVSPEEQAFIASGCSAPVADGVTSAVFNVSAYRGRTLTLRLPSFEVSTASSWDVGLRFVKNCQFGSAPSRTDIFRSAGPHTIVVPSDATYAKLFQGNPGGLGLSYSVEN